MMSKTVQSLAVMIVAAIWATDANAALRFHFDEAFNTAERIKLETWITEVAAGVESLVGPYPFDIHLYFEPARSREPVPWANTLRDREQGVRFHVDTRHSLEKFRRDWTAPHELSHLILPYLGENNAWFAEGFASYMQHQVMHATGALTRDATARRYRLRLDEAARQFRYDDRPFVDVAPKLRAERKFRVMYWGGAVFFLQFDRVLKANYDTSLLAVLSEYMRCCRRNRGTLASLIARFDQLIGVDVAAGQLATFRATPGFPDYGQIDPTVVDR